jgi:hypothetical protein
LNIKDNENLDFLDIITLLGFIVSMENLNANLTQNDKQELQNDLSEKAEKILNEIHTHLEEQDKKIDYIIERLNNDKD